MNLQFSLPVQRYRPEHVEERKNFVVADSLFDQTDWKSPISQFSSEIEGFIRRYQTFANPDALLLDSDINSRRSDVFQSNVGALMNHFVFTSVGSSINSEYSHYSTQAAADGSVSRVLYGQDKARQGRLANADAVVHRVADLAAALSDLQSTLNSNARMVVSPTKVDYHESYLQSPGAEILVSRNPDFGRFKILPEMIGMDVASSSSGARSTERLPLEFAAGSMLGWEFTSPQEVSIGSPGDLCAIIMDILYMKMLESKSVSEKFDANPINEATKKNIAFLYKQTSPLYDPLVRSDLILSLSTINEDINGAENPFVLGVFGDSRKIPSMMGLLSICRATRTPFYDRQRVSSTGVNASIEDIAQLTISGDENFIAAENQMAPSLTKDGWNAIVDAIKEACKPSGFVDVSDFNKAVTESKEVMASDLAVKSLNRTIDMLKGIEEGVWKKIVSKCAGVLLLNLIIASTVNWYELSNVSGVRLDTIGSDFKITTTKSGTEEKKTIGVGNLKEVAYRLYVDAQTILRNALGTRLNRAMGGTALSGRQVVQAQRFSEQVVYPGDDTVMETMASYLDILNSDLTKIGMQLQQGLENMAGRFWKRDVLRWTEIMCQVFGLTNANITRPETLLTIFAQVERILMLLYTKQITLMRDYTQRMVSFERMLARKDTVISVERQIKMASYFTSTAICYLKRQIIIIYYVLERLMNVVGPRMGQTHLNTFKKHERAMQVTARTWFRRQVSEMATGITSQRVMRMMQDFGNDMCGEREVATEGSVMTSVMNDEETKQLVSDVRFWLLTVAGLKGMDLATVSADPSLLRRLYVPVFSKTKAVWLMDIVPLLVNGTLGSKSSPNWLTATDLEKMEFPKGNPGAVILCNMSSQLSDPNSWKAISVEWFEKLIDQAEQSAKRSQTPDKKMWTIRFGIYLMFSDPTLYDAVSTKTNGGVLGAGNSDLVPDPEREGATKSKMKSVLEKIQSISPSQREEQKKFLTTISREDLAIEMTNARLVFQSFT